MKFTERFLIILIAIGIGLRFSSTEGGIFLQAIGSVALALFYVVFCFFLANGINYNRIFSKPAYLGITTWNVIGCIVSGFSFAMGLLAVLFKTMGWNGAEAIYLAGTLHVVVVFAVILVSYLSKRSPTNKRLLIRSGILVTLLLLIKIIELTVFRS